MLDAALQFDFCVNIPLVSCAQVVPSCVDSAELVAVSLELILQLCSSYHCVVQAIDSRARSLVNLGGCLHEKQGKQCVAILLHLLNYNQDTNNFVPQIFRLFHFYTGGANYYYPRERKAQDGNRVVLD